MAQNGSRFVFVACVDRPFAQDDEIDEAAHHGVADR
jgi:hypothetical protein